MSAAMQPSIEWETAFRSYRPLRIRYAAGEMICQTGSYLAGIHLIVRGVVSDMLQPIGGEQQNCDVLGPGDLIGIEILKRNPNGLSMSLRRALTAVELLFIERTQFEAALNDDPALLRAALGHVAAKYVLAREDPRQQMADDAQLCRLLLCLGQACGQLTDTGCIALPVEITLRTLGELLCISSRRLRQARESVRGLVMSNSEITFDPDEAYRVIASESAASG